ncbi:chemotaxis-specific protein-glutamate methyltransferase CheB [Oligoflexus tunisiensis]|uniref:chemotaxis-specific protein-glutamate methyltransferase CheB n=1 Tax=Oligoflexus tunisiensis TaxID=708132 RepID=UPI000AFAAB59|nr:chemotaxis-specific protein-glutamate methyltransferase CheB [Oligoflexus tunisiensis]
MIPKVRRIIGPLNERTFQFLQKTIERKTGIVFGRGKRALLESRLRAHLESLGLDGWEAYGSILARIPDNDPMWQDVINRVTTNKTGFFRESAHFEMLVDEIAPQHLRELPGIPFRIWSAACSTGEEAYTLAMVLRESLGSRLAFEITASDIDSTALAAASNGVYALSRLTDVPQKFQKYFERGSGEIADWIRVASHLKSKIKFCHFNLTSGTVPWESHFDLIFCRNVLIYFSNEAVQKVLASFFKALKPGGLLITGHAESLPQTQEEWVHLRPTLYQKPFSRSQKDRMIPPASCHARVEFVGKTHEHRSQGRKRALIIDDSKTVCQLLKHLLEGSGQLQVVDSVTDPRKALQAIAALKPDVTTLDISMPHIDGLALLKLIMAKHPHPVVMISSLQVDEGNHVLEALELGAIDYIQKPSKDELQSTAQAIREKIFAAASAKVSRFPVSIVRPRGHKPRTVRQNSKIKCIVIGSSTGGTEALRRLLSGLPEAIPPILIAQHIPKGFSDLLSKRLNLLCPFVVKEAAAGDVIAPGTVYIAPGGQNMKVVRVNQDFVIKISSGESETVHKPSVDILMKSVAESGLAPAIGIILTGMGSDGAQGLLAMKGMGARTMAQDEASCIVFGMPKEAIKIGAADKICPLESMAAQILEWIKS